MLPVEMRFGQTISPCCCPLAATNWMEQEEVGAWALPTDAQPLQRGLIPVRGPTKRPAELLVTEGVEPLPTTT